MKVIVPPDGSRRTRSSGSCAAALQDGERGLGRSGIGSTEETLILMRVDLAGTRGSRFRRSRSRRLPKA